MATGSAKKSAGGKKPRGGRGKRKEVPPTDSEVAAGFQLLAPHGHGAITQVDIVKVCHCLLRASDASDSMADTAMLFCFLTSADL